MTLGKVVWDDGWSSEIKNIRLHEGRLIVETPWAPSCKTAEHYRIYGDDGKQIYDAKFILPQDERERHANEFNDPFPRTITVSLSLSIESVHMVSEKE